MASDTGEGAFTHQSVFEFKNHGLCFRPPNGGAPQWRAPPEFLRQILEGSPANYFRSQQVLYGIVPPEEFDHVMDEKLIKQNLLHSLQTGAYLAKLPAMAGIEWTCIQESQKQNLKEILAKRSASTKDARQPVPLAPVNAQQTAGWTCINSKPSEASGDVGTYKTKNQTAIPRKKENMSGKSSTETEYPVKRSELPKKRGRPTKNQPLSEQESSPLCTTPSIKPAASKANASATPNGARRKLRRK